MDWESLRPDARQVLRQWTSEQPLSIDPVPGGTLNWNFKVSVPAGEYLLRCHRDDLESVRIAGEHRLLAWVVEQGIPAPSPVSTPSSETLVTFGAHRWSLAPWLPGQQRARGMLSAAQARSLGRMHGLIQATLSEHPDSIGASLSLRWDKAESLAALSKLITVAAERGEELWIARALDRQRALLDGMAVLTPEDISSLPCQLLHGDFHDQQVLFIGDEVSAVLDWEVWRTDPRAWELVRSLAFSKLLASPHLGAYLSGYRQHIVLGEDEILLALRLWFQSRIVGVWVWWAYLVEGNERVRQFLPDTVEELERVTDPAWTASVARAVVAALRA